MRSPRWVGALLLVVAAACGQSRPNGGKPRVAVSIFPLHDIASRVAGDRLDVVLVLPPGRSEHGYEPTPKEMARVADAKLALFAGYGMDEWAEKLVTGTSKGVTVVELAEKVDPRPFTLEHVGEEAAEEAEGEKEEGEEHHHHEEGGMDPHFWLDPVRMQTAVDVMVEAFGKLDPAGADGFKTRGEEVKRSLAALHADIEARSKTWTRKTIVTFHGSMGYFAARYGLTIAAVIEPFPGREPTPKYMGEVLDAIKRAGAAALFSEPQLDPAPAKVIAGQAGLPLHQLDPVGGTEGVDSYEKLIRHNASVLDQALR